MKVLLNTHGGLGNQIFQVFYALSIRTKEADKIYLQHLDYYEHKFSLEIPLEPIMNIYEANSLQRVILNFRFGKICEKLKISNGEFKFFNTRILDGYFQSINNYSQLPPENLISSIKLLRKIFGIKKPASKNGLIHLRLGDFFDNEQQKITQIRTSLNSVPSGYDIITNEFELLESTEFQDILRSKNINFISTKNFTARELLKLMSNYKIITSNGSTIALWAAILSGNSININHHELNLFHSHISRLSQQSL
jgi:hypothetical protein